MPFITQVVYTFSTSVLAYWPQISVGTVVTLFGSLFFFNRVAIGRRIKHWLQINVPIVGDLFRKINLANFSRTMALQSKSGVASVSALQLTQKAMTNVYYQELVGDIIDTIKRGGSYLEALKKKPRMVTPLVVLLISVGEQTGTFDEVLSTIAKYYSEEVRVTVKALTAMIEPLMIVFMGVTVGTIAASMFLPLFDLVNTMG
jgi:type II secretory pathway component PulF